MAVSSPHGWHGNESPPESVYGSQAEWAREGRGVPSSFLEIWSEWCEKNSSHWSELKKHPTQGICWQQMTQLRATFCNHRESPDNFNFFELLLISPKIPFDELFLKTILKTSRDIYFFENFRKSDRAPEVPIFEFKLCTKAPHHRILQKSPIGFRLLTEPSLSLFYMWDVIKYPYLNKWPFLTACKTTTWKCRDRLSKIAHFQGE